MGVVRVTLVSFCSNYDHSWAIEEDFSCKVALDWLKKQIGDFTVLSILTTIVIFSLYASLFYFIQYISNIS